MKSGVWVALLGLPMTRTQTTTVIAWTIAALMMVPGSTATPSPPQLQVSAAEDGVQLDWDFGDGAAVEIWKSHPEQHDGAWILHETVEGSRKGFKDVDASPDDLTVYVVRAVYADGTKSQPSPAAGMQYPHCEWVIIVIGGPVTLRPNCLLPPPWPASEAWKLIPG
jgi:hypothetical protein